jgi:hypothetical protein
VVADLEVADAGSDLLDDTGTLVTTAEGVGESRDVALGVVVVGVAQAGVLEADEDLEVLRVVDLDLDDLPLTGSLEEHSCA